MAVLQSPAAGSAYPCPLRLKGEGCGGDSDESRLLPVLRFKFQLDSAALVCGGRDSDLRPAGPDSVAHLQILQVRWASC
jgi:hypothetical protein